MGKTFALKGEEAAGSRIMKTLASLHHARLRREQANKVAHKRMKRYAEQQQALAQEDDKRYAFEQEAIPHMDALYNYAVRLCNQVAEADDLVQETYLKAYRFFDKFQQGTNCKAWLFRIMKNTYINRYRKAHKTPETVKYDTIGEFYYTIRSSEADPNNLQELFFNRLLGDEITAAVERLPEDFRAVVILCDLEGFTYEEIAEVVDCPVGTVRSRLHRGRKLLRESLIGYAEKHGYLQKQPAILP